MWEGVAQCGRVHPSVGGCAPVWEGVPQCGRVCPRMCVCEVWVSLSHVLMMDKCIYLCVHIIAPRIGHVAKAYLAKTSCCY